MHIKQKFSSQGAIISTQKYLKILDRVEVKIDTIAIFNLFSYNSLLISIELAFHEWCCHVMYLM